MTNLLSGYLEDRSTAQYFCFSIHREKRELYDAVYQREKNRARLAAGREAVERFSQCPICRRLVCDSCFLICDEMDMCRECAGRLKESGEPVAP